MNDDPAPPSAGGGKSRDWLNPRIGVLAAIAALPLALLALLLDGQQAFFDDDPKNSPTVTQPRSPATEGTGTPATPPPSGPPPSTPPPSSPPPAPPEDEPANHWTVTVRLASGGVDIDPRIPVKGNEGADLRKDDFTEIAPGRDVSLLEWTDSGAPGYAECRAHVEQSSDVPLFDVPEGRYICVRTNEDRIAVVRYLGIGEAGQFGFSVTVWSTN